jgi:hypothetical protein
MTVKDNTEDKEKIQETIPDLVFKMIQVAYSFSFASSLIDRMYQ